MKAVSVVRPRDDVSGFGGMIWPVPLKIILRSVTVTETLNQDRTAENVVHLLFLFLVGVLARALFLRFLCFLGVFVQLAEFATHRRHRRRDDDTRRHKVEQCYTPTCTHHSQSDKNCLGMPDARTGERTC